MTDMPTSLDRRSGPGTGVSTCITAAGLVAKTTGLLTLRVALGAAAEGRRLHVRLAPSSAKTSDVVVFAHRRQRAQGGCVALSLADLLRFLAPTARSCD